MKDWIFFCPCQRMNMRLYLRPGIDLHGALYPFPNDDLDARGNGLTKLHCSFRGVFSGTRVNDQVRDAGINVRLERCTPRLADGTQHLSFLFRQTRMRKHIAFVPRIRKQTPLLGLRGIGRRRNGERIRHSLPLSRARIRGLQA